MEIPSELLAIGIAAAVIFIIVVVVVIAFIVKNKKSGGQKLDAIDMAEQAERERIRSVLAPEEYERAMELRYKNKTDEAETKEYDALIAKSWELTRRRATDKQTQNTLTPDEHERWKALSQKTINMTEAELTEYDALERKRMQSPPPLATSQGTPAKKKRHWGWTILAIVLGGLAGGVGKLAGRAISVVAFTGNKDAQGLLMALVIGAIVVFFIVKSNKKTKQEKENNVIENQNHSNDNENEPAAHPRHVFFLKLRLRRLNRKGMKLYQEEMRLRNQILDAIKLYARGIKVDVPEIEKRIQVLQEQQEIIADKMIALENKALGI
ncbi:MAG: hypothetical protein ACOX7B_00375 [Christensenellales bacterium]|jgi:uncharacterized membrane protein